MNNITKYKKIFSTVFLAAYLSLVITNVIHFHSYSIYAGSSVAESSKPKSPGSHYLVDGSSICFIQLFSNTVLDLKYSSIGLSAISDSKGELNLLLSDKLPPYFYYLKNSPRAPPVFS